MKKFHVLQRFEIVSVCYAETVTEADIKAICWGARRGIPESDMAVREVVERNAFGSRKEVE